MDADFHERESEGFIVFTLTCTQYAYECKILIERGSDGRSHYLLFSFWSLQQARVLLCTLLVVLKKMQYFEKEFTNVRFIEGERESKE